MYQAFFLFPQLLETLQFENLLLPSAKLMFAYFSQKANQKGSSGGYQTSA
jgi:hypothetical protein